MLSYLIEYAYPKRMALWIEIGGYNWCGSDLEYPDNFIFGLRENKELLKDSIIDISELPEGISHDYDFKKTIDDIVTIYRLDQTLKPVY